MHCRTPQRQSPGGNGAAAAHTFTRRRRCQGCREHDDQELLHQEPATNFLGGYVVLALAFVLEGISFLRSVHQLRPQARLLGRDLMEQVMLTSDPTLRAVFAEDAAALVGVAIASAGLASAPGIRLGDPRRDRIDPPRPAACDRRHDPHQPERRFLIGEEPDPRVRAAAIQALLAQPGSPA